jgi:hypothetical protein
MASAGRRVSGLVDGALVRERFAAPGLWQDPEDLLHRRSAKAHVGAKPGVLHLRPPEAQPERESTVAQQLDGRRILRETERVMQRREDDAGTDLDP